MVGDDLLQILNGEVRESGNAVVADAVDVQPTVLGFHVGREFLQPILVLAEHPGDVANGEDSGDDGQSPGVEQALARTIEIMERCRFSLDEPPYQYPDEIATPGVTPRQALEWLTWEGAVEGYPDGLFPTTDMRP